MQVMLFLPDKIITREELAVMASRALQYVRPESYHVKVDLAIFKDYSRISEWALEEMRIAVSNGLLVGDTRGYLNPTGTSTYAQAVTVLERILRKLLLIS